MPRRVPRPLPGCAVEDSTDAPRIASPLRSVSYTLRGGSLNEVIALEAGTAAGVHLIRVINDQGRAAERDVQLQIVPRCRSRHATIPRPACLAAYSVNEASSLSAGPGQ